MGNKQLNNRGLNSKGFTLVELIAVVAIISMIAVYITIEINQSSDDAKIGLATAFLTSNVPGAISSFRARHMSSCRAIDDEFTIGDETYTAGGEATKANLVNRGLAANTPWDDVWTAEFNDDTREITIEFPLVGTNADTVQADLEANLTGRAQVVSVTGGAVGDASSGLIIVYSCS
ncbi:type II secretion system protein [Ketobacter alkanivorans]|nr:type II secretion system protein [Ketobacter alkanivorans]